MKIRRPARATKHNPAFGSSEGTGGRVVLFLLPQGEKEENYFGCSFSAAELMQ
jgi:hypothetical protein